MFQQHLLVQFLVCLIRAKYLFNLLQFMKADLDKYRQEEFFWELIVSETYKNFTPCIDC